MTKKQAKPFAVFNVRISPMPKGVSRSQMREFIRDAIEGTVERCGDYEVSPFENMVMTSVKISFGDHNGC